MSADDADAREDAKDARKGIDSMTTRGYTLREIDVLLDRSKGSAFRAFKRQRESLRENIDFTVLPARTAKTEIERLRAQGRIYRSSINVIVLAQSGFERVRAELERD